MNRIHLGVGAAPRNCVEPCLYFDTPIFRRCSLSLEDVPSSLESSRAVPVASVTNNYSHLNPEP